MTLARGGSSLTSARTATRQTLSWADARRSCARLTMQEKEAEIVVDLTITCDLQLVDGTQWQTPWLYPGA
jgi:hypothetical protein